MSACQVSCRAFVPVSGSLPSKTPWSDSVNYFADVYFRPLLQPSASHANVAPESFFTPPNSHQCVFFFPLSNHLLPAFSSLASGKPQRKWPSASEFKGIWELEICSFAENYLDLLSNMLCNIWSSSQPTQRQSHRWNAIKGLLKKSSEVTECEWMHLQVEAFGFCKVLTLSRAPSTSRDKEVNLYSRLHTTALLLPVFEFAKQVPHSDALCASGDSMQQLEDETSEQACKAPAFLVKSLFP